MRITIDLSTTALLDLLIRADRFSAVVATVAGNGKLHAAQVGRRVTRCGRPALFQNLGCFFGVDSEDRCKKCEATFTEPEEVLMQAVSKEHPEKFL